MQIYRKVSVLLALLVLSVPALAQVLSPGDVVNNTVTISTAVHFGDAEGQDVLVPAGAYWVIPGAGTIELINLEDGENYVVRAIVETHSENLDASIALSTPGTEEQPDTHSIAYLLDDGSQLTAEGSYSGILARGLLGDAKAKAAAARKAAQQRAAAAKRRAQAAAAEARRRAELAAAEARRRIQGAAAEVRRTARRDVENMLQEVAQIRARDGKRAANKKLVQYGPRLALASSAAFTPEQKLRLIAEARVQLRKHMPFIQEVLRRSKSIISLVKDDGKPLGDGRRTQIQNAIWGSGDNQLRHPFAGSMVTSRGLGDGIQPSWSVGFSGDISAVAGAGIGVAEAFPFDLRDPGVCNYFSASFDFGAQAGGAGNVDIGFYLGGYRTLGATFADPILGGLEAQVTLGVTVYAGVEIVLVFSIPSEDLAYIPLTAIQLGIGGGGEAEAALGLGYGFRAGCIPLD